MKELSDEEIAARVQQGDVESFRFLMERFEPKIGRYVKRFIFNQEDSQDVVQEVFIKAYVNIQSFDITRKFSSWVYRIAHNECINEMKRRGKRPLSIFDLDVLFPHLAAKETADSEANKQDLRNMLDQGLNQLSAKYREPLILYYYEDMDYREIAEILQIPVSTVGVRLARGKTMLKKVVKVD
jgi:RNA polymerase sigma-70 factor, ECF subfamily